MSLAFPSTVLPLSGASSELADARLRLRRFCADDAPLLFAAVRESMNELSVWLPWCHPGYALNDSVKFVQGRDEEWQKDNHYSLAITDAASGEFLGGIGLNFINRTHNLANLGYWVRSGRANRGVATAAVRLMARFGLTELKFTRLEIVAALGNLASQRVAEKVGARREGILRNGLCLRGQPHDAVMFSLIPADLPSIPGL